MTRADSAAEAQARRQERNMAKLVGSEAPDLKSDVAKQDASHPLTVVSEFKPAGEGEPFYSSD